MKNKKTGKDTSEPFFEAPEIKKIMANPKRRAAIEAEFQYLEFLENIARLRRKVAMSQNTLSKLTKISQEELSRIERGKRNITLETYFKIISGLGYEAEIKYHKIGNPHA